MPFNNKSILITGGTGSLGNEITRQLLENYDIKRLVIFSRDELKQYQMAQKFTDKRIRFFIGDVRDRKRLQLALRNIDTVIHAAALKHVPICEYNPFEAIKTNILGAQNVIETALECGVERVMALSTDKATNPINLYGATKLCSDKLFVAANSYTGDRKTKFSVVRYGNVLGSRGSVVPFFNQEKSKGVLPITDFEMTRFWITLPQATKFVLRMTEIMTGGELFVPKIPSMKMTDLATAICKDCKQEEVGIRPGEKMHEIMIPDDEAAHTLEFESFYVIHESGHSPKKILDSYPERGKSVSKRFSYASNTSPDFLSVEGLQEILQRENLL
jgi:UDP-N-acetylglucosamine 4,6-dehydratase